MTALPLAGRRVLEGKRILVTRAAHQASKLSDALRALGAEPVEVPVLEIQPPSDLAPLDRALRALDSYDWLILTSANTVRAIAWSSFLDKSSNLKVAAVGEATATAARKAGLPVALVPETYVAEALVDCLADQSAGKKILLARAEVARDVIPDALARRGSHGRCGRCLQKRHARGRAGAVARGIGKGNRCGNLHQFLKRDASCRCRPSGRDRFSLCRSSLPSPSAPLLLKLCANSAGSR